MVWSNLPRPTLKSASLCPISSCKSREIRCFSFSWAEIKRGANCCSSAWAAFKSSSAALRSETTAAKQSNGAETTIHVTWRTVTRLIAMELRKGPVPMKVHQLEMQTNVVIEKHVPTDPNRTAAQNKIGNGIK